MSVTMDTRYMVQEPHVGGPIFLPLGTTYADGMAIAESKNAYLYVAHLEGGQLVLDAALRYPNR